ncbi:hypothetical protein OPQ81_000732 [Rhizoctonia solani]|nr:hypothetical protein OPQ81_000732 [Rhizoctonia solani]
MLDAPSNAKAGCSLLSVDKHTLAGTTPGSHSISPFPTNGGGGDNEGPFNAILKPSSFVMRAPFPSIANELMFLIIAGLLEEDTDADALETQFESSRAEIEQVILDVCSLIEDYLVYTLVLSSLDLDEFSSKACLE